MAYIRRLSTIITKLEAAQARAASEAGALSASSQVPASQERNNEMAEPRLQFYAISDLLRAVVERDTCREEHLKALRDDRVDKAFREVAASLGYTVTGADGSQ